MPKLSDPAGSPRFPHRRPAKREKPILAREQFGPWRCDVRVTPITGLRAASPVFEVFAGWKHGPALDESHGPAPPGGMQAHDVYVVDPAARDIQLRPAQASELARAIALAAIDSLEAGRKPELQVIARELRRRF